MNASPTTSPDDEVLLERIRQNDHRAVETLIARYQGHILRFSLKMCNSREDAEDVAQEALLAATRTLKDFRGAASVSTWLYRITRSFCIKRYRRSKFAPEREESLDAESQHGLADPGQTPEEAVAAQEIEAAVERAIARLEPKYREVLILRDVEGLTAPEVAEVTELSVSAVKSRLHRARVTLRNLLSPVFEPVARPVSGPEGFPSLVEVFSQYLEGEIDAQACARMQAYVEENPAAKAMCDSLNRVLKACREVPTPEVPGPIQQKIREAIRRLAVKGT